MKNSNHYVSHSQTAESFCCYFDYAYGLTICNHTIHVSKPIRYNYYYHKLALLATSIFNLSHWRNDVTVASYLLA